MMKTQISIGGIRFCFQSEHEIRAESAVCPFFTTGTDGDPVNIRVIHGSSAAPRPACPMYGEDILLEYYVEKERLLTLSKGGTGGYLSTVVSNLDYSDITCYLNFTPDAPLNTLGGLLRLIPMCGILQKKGTMFFHAAQIEIKGKGILFSAPSGTGKTTQAKLWQEHRNARIICNDRTLVRSGWTYGYPVDGSEPVCSAEKLPLGAIVLLEQSAENHIRRMRPKEVLVKLMPLLVINHWDPAASAMGAEQLLELIQRFPVYMLGCTPDERAVECLEAQLQKDGVL